MLTDFREWLNTLTANEMGLFRGLLKVIGGFLFRQANSRNNSDKSGDQKISIKTPDGMEASIPNDTDPEKFEKYLQAIARHSTSQMDRPDERSDRSIDKQTAQQADEDLKELVADKAIKNVEDILSRALKAANKGDPEQSVRILEPLRSKYQSTKDIADRELARLAFVTATLIFANDPVRARPYLEEAATLAPDNFIYLIEYGRDLEVTGQRDKAKEIFMDALKVAESENNQRNIAWAKDDIGRIQEVQGDLEAALRSYQDGLNIAQKLAREDPSNKELQRDLSVSYNKIGDIQQAQGDLAGALKSYKQDLKIAKELAKEDPTNKEWQRDLSVSYSKIGNIEQAQGDLAGALKSYQDGLKIAQDLASQDPSNKQWQRDLSVSYNNIGDIQWAQGDLEGALSSYQDGLEIRKDLASQDPGNKEWQRDLSVSYERIGDIQRAQGDPEGALSSYQDGLAIRKDLVREDPGNMQWQADLAYTYAKMSFVDKESVKEHLLKAKDILTGPYEKGLLTAEQIKAYEGLLEMLDQHK